MPTRSRKPCVTHGCPNLTDKRYCTEHSREPDRHRKSAWQRGYDGAWRRVREQALKRDNYLCIACLAKGVIAAASDVDHIVPIRVRPDLRLVMTNTQSLCHSCHSVKTAQEDGSFGRPVKIYISSTRE